jgi:hypothetical protein
METGIYAVIVVANAIHVVGPMTMTTCQAQASRCLQYESLADTVRRVGAANAMSELNELDAFLRERGCTWAGEQMPKGRAALCFKPQ